MAFKIRRVNYYYLTVKDQPGEAYNLLNNLSDLGINLLAFSAVPIGPYRTQLTLFPDNAAQFEREIKRARLNPEGPHEAFLAQGNDELGALSGIHSKLFKANVNVYASNAVTDGDGSYGYILYVRQEEIERAAKALGI